jgi:hypothetical protein
LGPRALLDALEKIQISCLCWESNLGRPARRLVARQTAKPLGIRAVPGSNLSPESGFLTEVYRGFPQSLQANAGMVPQVRPWPLSSISFPIHCSLIILPLNTVYPESI